MKKKRRSWHALANYDAGPRLRAHETRAEINATTLPIDPDRQRRHPPLRLAFELGSANPAPIRRAGMTPELVRHIL